MTTPKIDLVYLWVDGDDQEWLKTKNYWLKKIKNEAPVRHDSAVSARWRDNDELKYSLRSAEMFAPWINHIYIVTSFGQVPKWLNTKHPKITIVSDEQIVPRDALPTFNSVVIEMCLMNIPNLSEHFLLANDDMFFNKPVSPEYFYDKHDRAIIWHSKNRNFPAIGYGMEMVCSDYKQTILVAANKIVSIFGKKYRKYVTYAPAHNIDPYFKSTMLNTRNHPLLSHDIDIQIRNKFRTNWELQRWIFNLYDIVHGKAVFKRARHFKKSKHFIYNLVHYHECKNAPTYCEDAENRLLHVSPPLFCINDTDRTSDETRKKNHRFLEEKFPHKSSFEI